MNKWRACIAGPVSKMPRFWITFNLSAQDSAPFQSSFKFFQVFESSANEAKNCKIRSELLWSTAPDGQRSLFRENLSLANFYSLEKNVNLNSSSNSELVPSSFLRRASTFSFQRRLAQMLKMKNELWHPRVIL